MGRGDLDRFTLRFGDSKLEERFQHEEGRASLGGYRIITGATVLLWVAAAFLIPLGTAIPFELSGSIGGAMAVVGSASLAAWRWANTMNRQHGLASLLTSANGLVILLLASLGGVVEGYAVGGIMLLFMFGFVSRTRFVFAVLRTAVIAAGLGLVMWTYAEPRSLLVDAFIFVAAATGSLVGLRLLERNRRHLWHQRLVIEEQSAAIEVERAESERLLLNVLPVAVSKRLRQGENPIADDFPSVSVVFADIVGFTPMASALSADQVIRMLSGLFSVFDDLVGERGLEKIKTIGDAYMAVGGLPEPLPDHAVRVVDLALAMLEGAAASRFFPDLSLRVGVHSGPVAGGVLGTRRFAYDVWGTTVNVAARLETAGVAGRVHVSEDTRSLTNDAFGYEPRGVVELRGLGPMPTYLVTGRLQGPAVGEQVEAAPA